MRVSKIRARELDPWMEMVKTGSFGGPSAKDFKLVVEHTHLLHDSSIELDNAKGKHEGHCLELTHPVELRRSSLEPPPPNEEATPPILLIQTSRQKMNTQPQATPMPTQQSPSSSFGLIVPGGPVRYDFAPVDQTGTKFALQLNSPGDLPSPVTLVNELVAFLGAPLPHNQGMLVYWQLTTQQGEQTGFELLGSLTTDQPSQVFRTGWSEHDHFLSLSPQQPVAITIGLSMESLDNIKNITSTPSAKSRRPLVAQKIAEDLYNFMQSFDTGVTSAMGQMTVPKNIFERWWKRFEAKSKRDPNFFLKRAD